MDRREALKMVSLIMGGTVIGSGAFLSGCRPAGKNETVMTPDLPDTGLMDAIGEAILPETSETPGAGKVHIGEFIITIVRDCYSPEEYKVFMEGIGSFKKLCRSKFGNNFINLEQDKKNDILDILERERKNVKPDNGLPHYYTMIKQLVIWGYLTSMEVSLNVLGYVPVPGRYDGCIPYHQGDHAVL